MISRSIQFLAPLLLGGSAAACAGDASDRSGQAHPDTSRWALGQPSVRVGTGSQELDRVYGGILLGDGSLVVGNSGAAAELRWYDRRGHLRSATGRRGAGPGEFGSINWITRLAEDSLVAFDLRRQRFSVWTPAGAYARSFRSQAPPGPVRPIGAFSDGSLLIAREGQYDPRGGAGVVRDSMLVLRVDRHGKILQTFGTFPGAEWLVYQHPTSFGATQLPFGRTGHLAVAGDHVVYGASESGRLTVYDLAGRLVRTLTPELPRHPLPPDAVSTFLSEVQDGPERTALARHHRRNPIRSGAVLTGLRGDEEGNLWVRLSPRRGVDTVKWVVITLGGERIGSIHLHTSALPLDIRDHEMLLRESDPDGVHHATVREVVR
jgi:hypothetical protein